MRLSAWHVPLDHVSASAIAMLIQCPEQFRLRRIKKIPETMGTDRFMGIVDHATHAENFKQKIQSRQDVFPYEMEDAYARNWDHTIVDEGEPDWDSHPDDTKTLGLQMMMLYHTRVSPTIKPIRVEERFEERLKGAPIPIVGYPDIETKGRLIERKTSAQKVAKPKAKWVVQGRIYSLVSGKPVEYHVVTKQKTPQVVTGSDTRDLILMPDHHDHTKQLIEQALATLNDCWLRYGPDRPWPTNGIYHDWLCSYCFAGPRYGNICVAWKGSS